jgi:AraC-like DNA-binding protein
MLDKVGTSMGADASPRAPLAGVQLLTVHFRQPPPPRLLSALSLVACNAGGGYVAWGRTLQPLDVGAVLVRAPQQVSAVMHDAAPDTRCRIVLVDPERLPPPTAKEAQLLLRLGSLVTRAPAVVSAMAALWDAAEREAPAPDREACLAALVAALVELATDAMPCPPPLSPPVARTRELLHERFADEVPLDDLAVVAGMSKCHLVHLFHKEVGLPPHAYQIQLRVARARALVAAGVPLADVASRSGFADQSHLTRLFKRVIGVPPGQYAAHARVGSAAVGGVQTAVGGGRLSPVRH